MADGAEILNLENSPFHRAYLSCKLPCPHILCRAELGRAFFEETGLVQHVRVKHARVKCNEKFKREACRLFRFKHGEETKNHVEWLSTRRLTEVCICRAELGRAFFEETGLVQHVRVKHARVKCNEKFKREACRLFRFKHGEETKNHVEWLSTRCLTEVCSFYCYCNLYVRYIERSCCFEIKCRTANMEWISVHQILFRARQSRKQNCHSCKILGF